MNKDKNKNFLIFVLFTYAMTVLSTLTALHIYYAGV